MSLQKLKTDHRILNLIKVTACCVMALTAELYITAQAYTKELKIGFAPEKPPFVFQSRAERNNGQQGIQIDIVAAALEGSGYTFTPVFAANKRIILDVINHDLDAGEMAGQKNPVLFYSGSIIEFKNYAITRKSEKLKINSVVDLGNLQVVAWQGAKDDLGYKFSAVVEKNPSYYENWSLKNQCSMFFARRVQVIVIDKNIFLWWKKELSSKMETLDELVYHPIFPGTNKYTLGFFSKEIRDVFERGLKRIKRDGTYDQIFNNYLR